MKKPLWNARNESPKQLRDRLDREANAKFGFALSLVIIIAVLGLLDYLGLLK